MYLKRQTNPCKLSGHVMLIGVWRGQWPQVSIAFCLSCFTVSRIFSQLVYMYWMWTQERSWNSECMHIKMILSGLGAETAKCRYLQARMISSFSTGQVIVYTNSNLMIGVACVCCLMFLDLWFAASIGDPWWTDVTFQNFNGKGF